MDWRIPDGGSIQKAIVRGLCRFPGLCTYMHAAFASLNHQACIIASSSTTSQHHLTSEQLQDGIPPSSAGAGGCNIGRRRRRGRGGDAPSLLIPG